MYSVTVRINSWVPIGICNFIESSSLSHGIQDKVAKELNVPKVLVHVDWIRVDDSFNSADLAIEIRFPVQPKFNPSKAEMFTLAISLVKMVKKALERFPDITRKVTCRIIPERDMIFASA